MRVCQFSAFVVALIGASQALANSGLPSQLDLDAMGLAGLEVMSDAEGLAIRGLGFEGATAYGHSWASVAALGAAAGTKNGYKSSGHHFAGGHNESEAELEIEIKFGHNGGGHNGNSGGWGNNNQGGHSKGGKGKMSGHNNCNSCGGHKGGGKKGGGHSTPKSVNINVNVSAGGSSIAFRK
jgi:hypothetical protein